jgi:hypothetical protein
MSESQKCFGGFILTLLMVVCAACGQARTSSRPTQVMTVDPQIIANMTSIPQATPLSGEEAKVIRELEIMVENCSAYSVQRRVQMEQHIDWLYNPAGIPQDIIMAFGAQPRVGLLRGMGGYTEIEWRQAGRPADSCLLPIGRRINELLVEADALPFPIFNP